MVEEANVVDPENVPHDEPAESSVEESGAVEESGSVEKSRGMRLLRRLVLLLAVALATVEFSSLLCSVYSLTAIETAFSNSLNSGLTLEAARDHTVGLAMISFREERDGSSESRPVHFAVFTWPSLFRNHSFEVQVEKIKSSNAEGGVIMVKSQPYISQEKIEYEVVQDFKITPDPQWMQILMLDFEPDSKGTHRVERWQVERAIKNKKYEPSLLVYFDEHDKNEDGVVTAGELGQAQGIEPTSDDKSKGTAGR